MATVGSLAYQIIANHTDFKAGIVATRQELKTLRTAFLESQAPVDRFSQSIEHLQALMAKFPSRAGELRKSIHAIKREMDAARFSRGASNEAGFLADLDAGLARNRARDKAFMAAQIPADLAGGGKSGLVLLKQNAEAANRALSAMNGGSVIPLLGSLASLGPAAIAGVAVAGLAAIAAKSIMAADAARQAREEFFKQLDAFKAEGGDTSFADHIERVESLSTKWGKARESVDMYFAAVGENVIKAGESADVGGMAGFFGSQVGGVAGGYLGNLLGNAAEAAGGAALSIGSLDPTKAAMRQLEEEKSRKRAMDMFRGYEEEMRREEENADRKRAEAHKEYARERERLAQKAFEATRDRMAKEAAEQQRRADEAMARDRKIRESVRTPAQNLRRELSELEMSGVDEFTKIKALMALEEKALGMGAGAGGVPMLQSQAAIRAGSVEALRANFPGGTTPDEKQLAEQKKTAKNTEEAKKVLLEIRDAIKATSIGVMP